MDREGIVKQVWAISVSVRVGGYTSRKEVERDDTYLTGRRERDGRFKEVVENVDHYKAAKKLESKLRGLTDAYAKNVDGFGYLCAEDTAQKFLLAFEQAMATEVAAHNALPGQTAPVSARAYARPYGIAFGPRDVADLLKVISEALAGARAALEEGRFEDVTNWLKRNQRLAGLLPSLNANVVADALAKIRECKNAAAAHVRSVAGTGKHREVVPPLMLTECRALPAWREMTEAVDAALGWLVPCAPEVANGTW